jgi:YVTN family beta-propeller protein
MGDAFVRRKRIGRGQGGADPEASGSIYLSRRLKEPNQFHPCIPGVDLERIRMNDQGSVVGSGAGRELASVAIVCMMVGSGVTLGFFLQDAPHPGTSDGAVLSGSVHPLTTTIGVGSDPSAEAYDSGKGEIFVANSNSDDVSVINDTADTVLTTIPVGTDPLAATYDSGKGEVFISNEKSANVSVISDATNTVVQTIGVAGYPLFSAYDSATGEIFVTNDQTSVAVISDTTNTVVDTIGVGNISSGAGYDPALGEVFTSNGDDGTVDVISAATNLVVHIIPVAVNPEGTLAYDSAKGEIFVAAESRVVSVISAATNKVVATVSVGKYPSGTAYDAATGDVFVPNDGDNNVSVISDATNTVIQSIPVGTSPQAVAYDSGVGEVFVANYGSSDVSVISAGGSAPTTYSVTFTETGLPAGSTWSVTLNGAMQSTTTSGTTFTEPNGTYTYTAIALIAYAPIPSNGTFSVNGAGVTQTITFEVFPLKFTEPGLPIDANWSVTLSGTPPGVILTAPVGDPSLTRWSDGASSVLFSVSNGTYSYTSSAPGYTGNASTVTVNGASPPPVSLTFTANSLPAASSAAGLPILDWVLVGAAIIVIAIAAAMLLVRRKRRPRPSPAKAAAPTGEGAPPAPP